MTTKPPKYSLWEAINVAISLGAKALEEIRRLAREPGPAGKDGRDGNDGIGIDDIEMALEDDGRVLVHKFLRERVAIKEFRIQTKTAIWRGPFDRGREYQPGDMATWNGSIWHCNKPSKGEIGSDNWSLAVKKGKDS